MGRRVAAKSLFANGDADTVVKERTATSAANGKEGAIGSNISEIKDRGQGEKAGGLKCRYIHVPSITSSHATKPFLPVLRLISSGISQMNAITP